MADMKSEDEAYDPFDPKNLTLGDDVVTIGGIRAVRLNGNGARAKKPGAVRRYKKRVRIKYYAFDVNVLDRAFATAEAKRNAWPILAVLMALHELWFFDITHRNPVRLTSENLRRFGLTRKQKRRALQILEEAKAIVVDRRVHQNPFVRLMWKPVVK